jgi:hypothetical protein
MEQIMRSRTWLLAPLLFLLGCGAGGECDGAACDDLRGIYALSSGSAPAEPSRPSPTPPPAEPRTTTPRTTAPRQAPKALVGANDARHWHVQDPEALAARLDAAGIGIMPIELNPAVIGRKRGCRMTPDEVQIDPVAYRSLVAANRRHDLITLVVLVNWNGCLEKEMTDAEFLERLDVVLSAGTDRVWIEPVSEPFADHGTFDPAPRRWTELARERWSGTFVMPNYAGGQTVALGAAWPDIPHDWVDYHPCTLENAEAALLEGGNHLVMTDCTPIFDPGPEAASHLTALSLETGVPLVFYGWIEPYRLRAETIDAIAASIDAAS